MEHYSLFCLQYDMENKKYLHPRRAMIAQATQHLMLGIRALLFETVHLFKKYIPFCRLSVQ